MSVPFEASILWQRLDTEPKLQQAIRSLREQAELLGRQIEHLLPGYTDHSVRHMDALWRVASVILTEAELARFSAAEAFVLGCAFYLHDLGMAFAATPEGVKELASTKNYAAHRARAMKVRGIEERQAHILAIQAATRELHAKKAITLVEQELPGMGRFLIQDPDLRYAWSYAIGQVSASHHWPLQDVDSRLGRRGRSAAPLAGEYDLGYLACVLRIVDYAHINNERAIVAERALRRSSIDIESSVHWFAQESIGGPTREAHSLKYSTLRPIESVEGWWLFYEMATGLQSEIQDVRQYLSTRTCSTGRFALEGVVGASSPSALARYIETSGFEPVDVRVRPYSVERLVDLLGGRSLYGKDETVAVRELVQNASDGIRLRNAAGDTPVPGKITIRLAQVDGRWALEVADNGIGMSENVLTNYLLGIASDYWKSSDFYSEFPQCAGDFAPAGRFGIGFLSVFMLGERVEVSTERTTGQRLTLKLRSVGARGALVKAPPTGQVGTTVRIFLQEGKETLFRDLERVVRTHAFMSEHELHIESPAGSVDIHGGWWKLADADVIDDHVRAAAQQRGRADGGEFYRGFGSRRLEVEWPAFCKAPEYSDDACRVIANPTAQLLAICTQGLLVGFSQSQGLTGAVEAGHVELNAARDDAMQWNGSDFRQRVLAELRPRILAEVDKLALDHNVPQHFDFLARLANLYGDWVLTDTKVPWLTVVQPPGSGILRSPEEFGDIARSVSQVVVVADVGVWSAWGQARSRYPSAEDVKVVVALRGTQGVGSSYEDADRVERGPLASHLEFSHRHYVSGEMLRAFLSVLARAWSVGEEVLVQQDWSRSVRKGELAGWLRRPTASGTKS